MIMNITPLEYVKIVCIDIKMTKILKTLKTPLNVITPKRLEIYINNFLHL